MFTQLLRILSDKTFQREEAVSLCQMMLAAGTTTNRESVSLDNDGIYPSAMLDLGFEPSGVPMFPKPTPFGTTPSRMAKNPPEVYSFVFALLKASGSRGFRV